MSTKQLLSANDWPSDIPVFGTIDLSHAIESFQPGNHRNDDLPVNLPIFNKTGKVKRLSSDVELMKRRVVSMPLPPKVVDEPKERKVSGFKERLFEWNRILSVSESSPQQSPQSSQSTPPPPPRKDTYYRKEKSRIDRRIMSFGQEPKLPNELLPAIKFQQNEYSPKKALPEPPSSDSSPASGSKFLIIDDDDSLFSDLMSFDFTAPSDSASHTEINSSSYSSNVNPEDKSSLVDLISLIKVYASPSPECSDTDTGLSPENSNKSVMDTLFSDMDLDIGDLTAIQKPNPATVHNHQPYSRIPPQHALAHELDDTKDLPAPPSAYSTPLKVSESKESHYTLSDYSSLSDVSSKKPVPLNNPKSRKNMKSYQNRVNRRSYSDSPSNESMFSTDSHKSLIAAKNDLKTFVRQRPFSYCLDSGRSYSDSKFNVPLPQPRSTSFNQNYNSEPIKHERPVSFNQIKTNLPKARAVSTSETIQPTSSNFVQPASSKFKVRSISALPITQPDIPKPLPRKPPSQFEFKEDSIKKHVQSFFHGLKRQEIDRKCLIDNQTKMHTQANTLDKRLPRTPERENRFGNRNHYTN